MSYNKFLIRHLGIYYMLIASMLFAGTGALSKLLSSELSSIEIVFFRNIIGLFLIIFMIYQRPLHQTGGKFWLLAFRGIIGTIGLYAFFYNIAHLHSLRLVRFLPHFLRLFYLKRDLIILVGLLFLLGLLEFYLLLSQLLELVKMSI